MMWTLLIHHLRQPAHHRLGRDLQACWQSAVHLAQQLLAAERKSECSMWISGPCCSGIEEVVHLRDGSPHVLHVHHLDAESRELFVQGVCQDFITLDYDISLS